MVYTTALCSEAQVDKRSQSDESAGIDTGIASGGMAGGDGAMIKSMCSRTTRERWEWQLTTLPRNLPLQYSKGWLQTQIAELMMMPLCSCRQGAEWSS